MSTISSVRRRAIAVVIMLLVAAAIVAPTLAVGPLATPAFRALKAVVDVVVAYRSASPEPARAPRAQRRTTGVDIATIVDEPAPLTAANVLAFGDSEAWLSANFLSQSMSLGIVDRHESLGSGGSQYGSQGSGGGQGGRRAASSAGGSASGGSGAGGGASGGSGDGTSGEINPPEATAASTMDVELTALAEMLAPDVDALLASPGGDAIPASSGVSDSFSAPGSPADFPSLLKAVTSEDPLRDPGGRLPGVPGESSTFVPPALTARSDEGAPLARPTIQVDTLNARVPEIGAAVPEPASLILLGASAAAVLRRARRGRRGLAN